MELEGQVARKEDADQLRPVSSNHTLTDGSQRSGIGDLDMEERKNWSLSKDDIKRHL
jgi:hypothetical protein